jgi:hypothetical protein
MRKNLIQPEVQLQRPQGMGRMFRKYITVEGAIERNSRSAERNSRSGSKGRQEENKDEKKGKKESKVIMMKKVTEKEVS